MQPPPQTEKQALFPGLLGAGIGALASPKGRRNEGAIHGGARELGALTGGGAGLAAGGLTGMGIGTGLSALAPQEYKSLALAAPTLIGALGGAGLGGYGGYHAGAGIAKDFTNKKAPWQSKKRKPAVKKKESEPDMSKKAQQAYPSLYEKAAAMKAAVGNYANPTSHDISRKTKGDELGADRTFLGFKKTHARLAHDIRMLEAAGRTEDAAKLRASLPKNYNTAATNPYDRVSESRRGGDEPKDAPAKSYFSGLDMSNPLLHAGGGALAGGAAGAMLSSKNKLRNALLGAAAGGAGTYVGSHLAQGGNLQSMLSGIGLDDMMGKKSGVKRAYEVGGSTLDHSGKNLEMYAGSNKYQYGPKMPPWFAHELESDLVNNIRYSGDENEGYTADLSVPLEQAQKHKILQQYIAAAQKEHAHTQKALAGSVKKSAFDFGKMLGDAGTYAKDLYNKVPAGVMQGAGMGGIGGGLAGGLAGLLAPGEEDVYDDMGNRVGRKQRGRFGAALRGLLGGGLLGAGAGGAAGYFAPDAVNSAYGAATGFGSELARRLGFGQKKQLNSANPTTAKELALAGEQSRGGDYAKSYRGADTDLFGESLRKGNDKRMRDLQTASAPGTMGASVAGGSSAGVKNPLYKGPNTADMKMPGSPTYTPTDTAGIAARRNAQFAGAQGQLMTPRQQAMQQQRANQASMEQSTGIRNVSPEVAAMQKNDPEGFARMMQEARDRRAQENLKTAPSMGFDATGIDMGNMRMPGSATMGR